MKFTSSKPVGLLFLSLVILAGLILGCSPSTQPVDDIVAATLTAVAVDQTRIAEHVAETVAAMPANETEPSESEKMEIAEEVVPTDTPEPTATPVPPTPEPTIEDTAAKGSETSSVPQIRMAEQMNAINVRRGPNICFDVVAVLHEDMIASIVGRDTQGIWYQLELTNGGSGWIWSENIELLETDLIENIPLATSNLTCPTATPLPTIPIPATSQATEPQKPSGGSSNPTKVPTPKPPSPTEVPCEYPYC